MLLVDDDPNLLVLLADQLRADGYEIQTARDGDEALRRLRTAWPDLLIIDMMMPRMDGLTLAREIKAQADLPIIVLSAIDAGDSKADLLEEVAEDYVTKPYHYPELRARINRVLRRLGDKVPRQSLVLGPSLTLDLHRREATVGGETVQLTPDRVAPALRPRREPRPDRHDRDAPRPRLGRDRGRRPVLRLGHDAPPPPEGRGRPEPAGPRPDGPRRRLPARRARRRRRLDRARRRLTAGPADDVTEPPPRRSATRRGPTRCRRGRRAPDATGRRRAAVAAPPTRARRRARDEASRCGLGLGASRSGRGCTLGLIAAAVLPLAGFGIVVLLMHDFATSTDTLGRLLLLGPRARRAGRDPALLPARGRPHRAAAGDRGGGRPRLGRRPLDPDRRRRRGRAGPPRRQPQPPGGATSSAATASSGRILAAIEQASPRDGAEFARRPRRDRRPDGVRA